MSADRIEITDDAGWQATGGITMKQEAVKTLYEWKKGDFGSCKIRRVNTAGSDLKYCMVSERCQWALGHYEHKRLCMNPSIGQTVNDTAPDEFARK